MTPQEVIADALVDYVSAAMDGKRWVDDASRTAVDDLSAAGFTVVPTTLLVSARTVVDGWAFLGDASDGIEALAASLAIAEGRDPLEVLQGKP